MPYMKFVTGHTSTKGIKRYLEKDGRALAEDYLNLNPQGISAFDWSVAMDSTRRAFGNDLPWRGLRVRTFKHYIVSPDPADDLDLDALRELSVAWAEENFADFEVAIIYHDDNANRVPHAHVVVNNTNLETSRRLQEPDPRALKRSLQKLAADRGLRFMAEGDTASRRTHPKAPKGKSGKTPHASRQREYSRKAEREIAAKGEYSWVSDIRRRVSIARNLAGDEAEFKQVLATLGIDVSANSPKAERRDWVYSFQDAPTRRISGERLGLSYGKEGMADAFGRSSRSMPDPNDRARAAAIARDAVEIGGLDELHELASTLETNIKYSIRCIADYRNVIELIGRNGSTEHASREIERLAAARRFSQAKGIVPETTSSRPYGKGAEGNRAGSGNVSDIQSERRIDKVPERGADHDQPDPGNRDQRGGFLR